MQAHISITHYNYAQIYISQSLKMSTRYNPDCDNFFEKSYKVGILLQNTLRTQDKIKYSIRDTEL